MPPFYITTPIYYVNDVPHLGHAYTTIVADTLARYHRMRGDDTFFLTGTDEHGQKIEEAAHKRGLTAQQLVDEVAPRFAETWKTLGITNDHFVRTTDASHESVVTALWHRLSKNGALYLETYQGWYCVGCEAFYPESQLEKIVVDGKETFACTTHKRPVDWIDKERSWFFKLSHYATRLLEHIETHPEFIQPEQYKNEVLAFIRGGLKDLSVSRTSFKWGIHVPEPDPEGHEHVMYVWLDALTNYLSVLCDPGELTGARVDQYWGEAIHVIGKDILRFHAVYWPAFLLAANLQLPKQIRCHGWWTIKGAKISKSMPATRVAPVELATTLGELGTHGFPVGNDAMRYYLLRETPLGNDGDFTFESLLGRYNADLANDLGNLINRSLTMITSFQGDFPPALATPTHALDHQLIAAASEAITGATQYFDALQPSRALEAIWKFVGTANHYIDQMEPWKMAKAQSPDLPHTLWALGANLWLLGRLIAPVLPATAAILRGWIGDPEATWPVHLTSCPPLAITRAVAKTPLFPRLDAKQQAAIIDRLIPPDALKVEAPAAVADATATITFDDFAKLDLRVGTIVTAAAIPKKDKLLHLTVDLGEAAPRTIVSGLAERYQPAELVGRQVIVVANLAPRKLGGLMSAGMVLSGGDDAILGLSTIDERVPPGTKVK